MLDSPQLQLFSDTDSATESVLISLLRKKQAAEKIHMVDQLNASLRVLTISGLRKRYPEVDENEFKLRLAQLLYGIDLAQKISPKKKTNLLK